MWACTVAMRFCGSGDRTSLTQSQTRPPPPPPHNPRSTTTTAASTHQQDRTRALGLIVPPGTATRNRRLHESSDLPIPASLSTAKAPVTPYGRSWPMDARGLEGMSLRVWAPWFSFLVDFNVTWSRAKRGLLCLRVIRSHVYQAGPRSGTLRCLRC